MSHSTIDGLHFGATEESTARYSLPNSLAISLDHRLLVHPFRAMHDNQIPMDLLEALFLSIIMHAVDHVLGYRILWGLNFKFGFDWENPSTP